MRPPLLTIMKNARLLPRISHAEPMLKLDKNVDPFILLGH
jgi:hypothetical protein